MIESAELNIAISAAKTGEAILKKYFADLASAGIENKTTDQQYQGLVTQADVESEQAIIAKIRESFPGHHFMAEEEHADGSGESTEHLWIIDPLDGTNNFAHGIPHFAVSIAYYHNGVAKTGVVLNPSTGDLFTAEQGGGAWWNGSQVSRQST